MVMGHTWPISLQHNASRVRANVFILERNEVYQVLLLLHKQARCGRKLNYLVRDRDYAPQHAQCAHTRVCGPDDLTCGNSSSGQHEECGSNLQTMPQKEQVAERRSSQLNANNHVLFLLLLLLSARSESRFKSYYFI